MYANPFYLFSFFLILILFPSKITNMSDRTPETVSIPIASIIIEHHRDDIGDIKILADSIRSNGLINPIVVDNEWRLIAGYRRYKACITLGMETIDARLYEDLSAYERRKLTLEEGIIHKKTLTWQEEVELKRQIHELYTAENPKRVIGAPNSPNLKRQVVGWTQEKTATVLGVAISSLSDDIRLALAIQIYPELKKVPSKFDALRQMYRLRERELLTEMAMRKIASGEAQLQKDITFVHGDSLKEIKKLADESVHLIVTDPPWGGDFVAQSFRVRDNFKMYDDSVGVYSLIAPDLFRVLKNGAHAYIFFSIQNYQPLKDILLGVGFEVEAMPLIWVKEGGSLTNTDYRPMIQYEPIFYCIKRADKNSAPRPLNEPTSNVLNYQRNKHEKIHPSEKPVDLMRRLIQLSSNKGDLVLDAFAGSGSTLIAAALLGRKVIGYEIDEDYYKLTLGRIQRVALEVETTVDEQKEVKKEYELEA